MNVLEFMMTNWEVFGLLLNALLGILYLRQRTRLKATETTAITAAAEAERVKAQATGDLEEVRNQGEQNRAMLHVLEGTLTNMGRLAAGIEEGNAIRRQEASNVSAAVAGMADSHKQVTTLIKEFQNFSKVQHDNTRETVSAVGVKVDTVVQNLQQAVNDASEFRKGMNGRFNHLDEQLKERFDSLQRNLEEGLKKSRDTNKLDASKLDHAPDAGDGSAAA